MSLEKPENIISFLKDGTACVVFFPFAPELTESEKKRIDAAPRMRFFVYGCSDAPMPPGVSGWKIENYPTKSVRWSIDRSTYMSSGVLPVPLSVVTPEALLGALMDLAAKAGNDDHPCVLMCVVDHPFVGDDVAMYRENIAVA